MSDPRNDLKLYVAGERSGNPGDWNTWSSREIVLASNKDEARMVVDDPLATITEINATRPCVIASMPVYHDGL